MAVERNQEYALLESDCLLAVCFFPKLSPTDRTIDSSSRRRCEIRLPEILFLTDRVIADMRFGRWKMVDSRKGFGIA